jgi:hypothetical protein
LFQPSRNAKSALHILPIIPAVIAGRQSVTEAQKITSRLNALFLHRWRIDPWRKFIGCAFHTFKGKGYEHEKAPSVVPMGLKEDMNLLITLYFGKTSY